ncbi:uncharacterized protein [Ranitomeya imitator]|uniref:uncharacterized protein n=1 Tax=Ranitomeya imitator TaxID=111125 RepID=UPI0037E8914C
MSAPIKIASLNVRSLKSPIRRAALFSYLETLDFDLFFLQECGIQCSLNYKDIKEDWTLGTSVWSGANDCRAAGIGLLCRGHSIIIQSVTEIMPGRAILVHLNFKGLPLRILNVYAPPGKQERAELFDILPLFCVGSTPLLVGGDFNCTREGECRQGGDVNRKDRTTYLLKSLIDDFKLQDCWKVLMPADPGVTWSNGRVSSRIDFIFASIGFKAHKCSLLSNLFSDHKVLSVELELEGEQKISKGSWRLNTTLLEDPEIQERFVHVYQHWQSKRDPRASMLGWWERIKPKIKFFFIKEGKNKAKQKKQWFYVLNMRLQVLFKLKDVGVDVDDDIANLKSEIKSTLDEKGKQIIFNSHVQHLEEGEKCSRFFFKKLDFLDQSILSSDLTREELLRGFKSFSNGKAPAMDPDPGDVPTYALLKHTVRIYFEKGGGDGRGLKFVVGNVLEKALSVRKHEILAIQDYPRRGIYDVTFTGEGIHQHVCNQVISPDVIIQKNPELKGVKFAIHDLEETRLLIVKIYSPHMQESEIGRYLLGFFKKVNCLGKILNECGIWTSKWRYVVTCVKNASKPGGVDLPPARFKIGKTNGDLYFNGMPSFCRKCKLYGHSNCDPTCAKCGSQEHKTEQCQTENMCTNCLAKDHSFSFCPNRKNTKGAQPEKEQPPAPCQPSAGSAVPETKEDEEESMDESNEVPGTGKDGYTEVRNEKARRRRERQKESRQQKEDPAEGTAASAKSQPLSLRSSGTALGRGKSDSKRRKVQEKTGGASREVPPQEPPDGGGKPEEMPMEERATPPSSEMERGSGVATSAIPVTPVRGQPAPELDLTPPIGPLEGGPVGDQEQGWGSAYLTSKVLFMESELVPESVMPSEALSDGESSEISSLMTVADKTEPSDEDI